MQSEIHSYEEEAVNTYGKMPEKAVVGLFAFWQRLNSRFTKGSPRKCDLRGSYKCQSIAEPGNWNFSYLVRYFRENYTYANARMMYHHVAKMVISFFFFFLGFTLFF